MIEWLKTGLQMTWVMLLTHDVLAHLIDRLTEEERAELDELLKLFEGKL